MNIIATPLEGLLLIEPRCFEDERGFFLETFQAARYREAGISERFVQDNQSRSRKGVLRGLHFQVSRPQAQLVTVMRGRVFDVGVDVRPASSTFGRWFGVELGDTGPRQLYMAPGFAHGFCVLSDWADLHYKVSRHYDSTDEGGLRWNDPDVGIAWPIDAPDLAPRDAAYPVLREIALSQLPHPLDADGE
jgi:dTDP-4-dehydrorhamnose 3,5-epimerase